MKQRLFQPTEHGLSYKARLLIAPNMPNRASVAIYATMNEFLGLLQLLYLGGASVGQRFHQPTFTAGSIIIMNNAFAGSFIQRADR
jgi:hypothetical protein